MACSHHNVVMFSLFVVVVANASGSPDTGQIEDMVTTSIENAGGGTSYSRIDSIDQLCSPLAEPPGTWAVMHLSSTELEKELEVLRFPLDGLSELLASGDGRTPTLLRYPNWVVMCDTRPASAKADILASVPRLAREAKVSSAVEAQVQSRVAGMSELALVREGVRTSTSKPSAGESEAFHRLVILSGYNKVGNGDKCIELARAHRTVLCFLEARNLDAPWVGPDPHHFVFKVFRDGTPLYDIEIQARLSGVSMGDRAAIKSVCRSAIRMGLAIMPADGEDSMTTGATEESKQSTSGPKDASKTGGRNGDRVR